MMNDKRYGKTLLAAAAALLLSGCSKDDALTGTDSTPTPTKRLMVKAATTSFLEAEPMTTRSLPVGYKSFNEIYPQTTPFHSSIGLILTPNQTSVSSNTATYSGGFWESHVSFTAGQQYYLYGFMPKEEETESASITSLNGDYANGAVLTITGMNTLTPADVCVVVGVQKTDEAMDLNESGIQLGRFSYVGSEENNYVYLLLKHLYAGLHFKLHLDTKYGQLRTIKVKKMTLTTVENIHTKINLSVTLTANNSGTDPVTAVSYVNVGETAKATISLFPFDGSDEATAGNELRVPVETSQDLLSCFAPASCNAFTLYTKYDVYDRNGNLIRKDCEAYNSINSSSLSGFNELQAGEVCTIDLKIQPTYLYVLSDPDLDNPEIVIE